MKKLIPNKKYYLVHNEDVLRKLNYRLELKQVDKKGDKFLVFDFVAGKKI